MKKITALVTLAIVTMSVLNGGTVSASGIVPASVSEQTIQSGNSTPEIKNGKSYVPYEFVNLLLMK
jgi:hypothetical protein